MTAQCRCGETWAPKAYVRLEPAAECGRSPLAAPHSTSDDVASAVAQHAATSPAPRTARCTCSTGAAAEYLATHAGSAASHVAEPLSACARLQAAGDDDAATRDSASKAAEENARIGVQAIGKLWQPIWPYFAEKKCEV